MRKPYALFILFFMSTSFLTAAKPLPDPKKDMKGEFYIYWGYNRAVYSNSDIHFHGGDFDFTVKNTVAKDRQSPFGVDPYFRINQITIPQYNYRIGYQFRSRLNISVGFDHMKYVVVQDQMAKVDGSITDINSRYSGVYRDSDVKLSGDFLQFEHTDGLNYLNTELNRTTHLAVYKKFDLYGTLGAGAGLMFPRTRAVILDRNVNDQWHFSGYGVSMKTGLNLSFNNHLFIQWELKAGYIDMPDIIIEAHSSDRASQHFNFVQTNILFGYRFKLLK